MEAKPDWLPDWCWQEYLDSVSSRLDALDREKSDERYEDALRKIIFSPKCKGVWDALKKREDDARARRAMMLERRFPGARMRECFLEPEPVTMFLASSAAEGLEGLNGAARASKSERTKKGAAIAELCVKLSAELDDLRSEDQAYPQVFSRTLALAAASTANSVISENVAAGYCQPRGDFSDGLAFGAYCIAVDPKITLDALLAGSLQWAETEPLVARPNGINSERLYFLRVLTSGFLQRFGTPLREVTLAVTGVFFDCEDLDASTVAKLAPVKKLDQILVFGSME